MSIVLVVPQLATVTAWGGLSRPLAALHARDAPLRRPGPSGEEAVRRGREGRPIIPPLALQVP